jgi:hypothetical protein
MAVGQSYSEYMRQVNEEAKLFSFHFSQKPICLARNINSKVSLASTSLAIPRHSVRCVVPNSQTEPQVDEDIVKLQRRLKGLGLDIDLADISKKVETATSRLIGDPLLRKFKFKLLPTQFPQSACGNGSIGMDDMNTPDELKQRPKGMFYPETNTHLQIPRLQLQNLTTAKSRLTKRPSSTRARIQDRSRIGIHDDNRIRSETHKRPSTSRGRLESATASAPLKPNNSTPRKKGFAKGATTQRPPSLWMDNSPRIVSPSSKTLSSGQQPPAQPGLRPGASNLASAGAARSLSTSTPPQCARRDSCGAADSPRDAAIEDDIIAEEDSSDEVIIYQAHAAPPAGPPPFNPDSGPDRRQHAAAAEPPPSSTANGPSERTADPASPRARPVPIPGLRLHSARAAPAAPAASATPRPPRPISAAPRVASTPRLSPRTNRREPLGISNGPDTPGPGACVHPPVVGPPSARADRGGVGRAHWRPRLLRIPCALALSEGRFRPVVAARASRAREALSRPWPGHYGLGQGGLDPSPPRCPFSPCHCFGPGDPARLPSIAERYGLWTPGPGEGPSPDASESPLSGW